MLDYGFKFFNARKSPKYRRSSKGLSINNEEIMTAISKTNKQLITEIKKTWDSALLDAKSSLNKAIRTGELLIELKKNTPHGQWESVLNDAFDASFGRRHAAKLMKIASQKDLLKIASNGEILTISDALQVIADATPEQLEKVELLKREEEAKRQQAEADRAAKAAELEAKRAEEETLKRVQAKDEPIEGEFTEVKDENPEQPAKPAEKPEVFEPEEAIEQALTEANEILHADNQELIKEIDSVTKILESNDQIAAAIAEAKKYRELNRVLNERITGLQNEKNEAIRSVKYWKNRAEKAERELAKEAA